MTFKIRDIYIPDPLDVLFALRGDDLLEGTVIDVSDSGTDDGRFVVVAVREIAEPVVVPANCINEI